MMPQKIFELRSQLIICEKRTKDKTFWH